MPTLTSLLCFAAAFASICSAQSQLLERTFTFSDTIPPEEKLAVASLLRITSDIRSDIVKPELNELTAKGTLEELDLAGWLLGVLEDRRHGRESSMTVTSAKDSDKGSVRVSRLRDGTSRDRGERLAQMVRVITEARRCTFALESLAVRGSAQQIALTAWLLDRIDVPFTDMKGDVGNRNVSDEREFRIADAGDRARSIMDGLNVVHIVHPGLAHSKAIFAEIDSLLRVIGNFALLWRDVDTDWLVLRGTEEQIGFAEWLSKELFDRTISRFSADEPSGIPAHLDFRLMGRGEIYPVDKNKQTIASILYLNPSLSMVQMIELATLLKERTGIRQAATFTPLRAVVIRGTPDQIVSAHQMLGELANWGGPPKSTRPNQ